MIKASSSARLLPATVLLLAASACGNAHAATDGGTVGPDTIAIRVDQLTGLQPADATRLPVLVVYGDGRVLTEKAVQGKPALPTILQRRISTAAVRILIDRATQAGVGAPTDFGKPPAPDAAVTRFTVTTSAGVRTMEVAGLSDHSVGGLTAAQQEARTAAQGLLAALTDLPATLGADAVGPADTYVPTGVAAVAAPWNGYCPSPPPGVKLPHPCGAEPGGRKARTWPGPTLPGHQISDGTPIPCVTVTGHAATTLLTATPTAITTTTWASGGARWRVSLRPLLPSESSCAGLAGTGGSTSAGNNTTQEVTGPPATRS
jgi:hypothetical protein